MVCGMATDRGWFVLRLSIHICGLFVVLATCCEAGYIDLVPSLPNYFLFSESYRL